MFPALAGNSYVYLNSGGSGPPSRETIRAMREADELCSGPAYLEGADFYARQHDMYARAREAAARLVATEAEGFTAIRRRANLLAGLLEGLPRVTLRSPRPARSGLVSFEVEGVAAKEAAERLLAKKFVVRFIPEPYPYVRASTHLFNTEEELEAKAVSRL